MMRDERLERELFGERKQARKPLLPCCCHAAAAAAGWLHADCRRCLGWLQGGPAGGGGINFDKYEDIPVDVSGENVPAPLLNFADVRAAPAVRCCYAGLLGLACMRAAGCLAWLAC